MTEIAYYSNGTSKKEALFFCSLSDIRQLLNLKKDLHRVSDTYLLCNRRIFCFYNKDKDQIIFNKWEITELLISQKQHSPSKTPVDNNNFANSVRKT